jgi:hypothetical protein
VKDEFLLAEKLEGAVTFRVNSVPKTSVNGWKHSDDRTQFMIVGCVIDSLANRKLRHRKLLLESSMRLYPHEAVLLLNEVPSGISDGGCCYNVSMPVPGSAVPIRERETVAEAGAQ